MDQIILTSGVEMTLTERSFTGTVPDHVDRTLLLLRITLTLLYAYRQLVQLGGVPDQVDRTLLLLRITPTLLYTYCQLVQLGGVPDQVDRTLLLLRITLTLLHTYCSWYSWEESLTRLIVLYCY